MDKLSKEEVLHVAKLARLELSDEEIEKYRKDLKDLFDEIENQVGEITFNPFAAEIVFKSPPLADIFVT